MKKNINTICNSCDSEFTLIFDEDLVTDFNKLVCPFCGEELEDLNEKDIDEQYDLFDEDSWG